MSEAAQVMAEPPFFMESIWPCRPSIRMLADVPFRRDRRRQLGRVGQQHPRRAGTQADVAFADARGPERCRVLIVNGRRNGNAGRQPDRVRGCGLERSGRRGGRQESRQLLLADRQARQQIGVGPAEPGIVEHGDAQRRCVVGPPAAEPTDDHVADEADTIPRVLSNAGDCCRRRRTWPMVSELAAVANMLR